VKTVEQPDRHGNKVTFEVTPLMESIAVDVDYQDKDGQEFSSVVSNITVEKAEELVDALQYAILSVRGEA
jgi:hypothetical protein